MINDEGIDGDSTGDFSLPATPGDRRSFGLETAGLTHPGLVRDNNEDTFLIARLARSIEVTSTSLRLSESCLASGPAGMVLIVADGMGGVAGGERASALAVETLMGYILDEYRSFLHAARADEAAILRELKSGFDRADGVLIREAATHPNLEGMGTTLAMAYLIADTLYILHAGDSRVYHRHGGKLRQVTVDHSLVEMLVALGSITAEDAKTHHQRNVVTNVVGGPSDGVRVDVSKVLLEDGDLILLCTDGLTEPVDDATIAKILGEAANPAEAAHNLLDEALRRGGPDNVTVVVARARAGA